MRILILGGTVFLGRHLAEIAKKRGHSMTLFNRGHHPEVFSDIEQLHGDRDGDLEVLKNRRWDAVIDTSGYVPRIVRQSAQLLSQLTDHYTFISSISVYQDFSKSNITEQAEVGKLDDEAVEDIGKDNYGPLKALCESVVQEVMPGRSLVIRPGLIVGPHDPTDRFTYWAWRIRKGGTVLAPGNPEAPVQWIDVRDLASWILDMVEKKQTGVYHATGPKEPLTMKAFLESSVTSLSSQTQLQWAEEDFLLKQDVGYWMEMPLWIPEKENMSGFQMVDNRKAVKAGLLFRPIQETIRDTAEWASGRPSDYEWRAGMSAEREQEILRKARNGQANL
ncbi:NAD-dependent epimerase/dehydratase family protein [Sporolactobacillus shoreae]|uniref:NAD-dependent epimerase/dehydratase family protein n=1 Tax=Sporolactobacillus shoreae TaxID=1465501 RepID=A0A4Z0GNQ4_9BACL|nr:NAD-dependent epimerase/dehydratase family protein [Sporolactobacillus shoreae]TGA97608.1 NAD-dependent epimerase/dehydratase family protein [Sporolactobacillus shoreae]